MRMKIGSYSINQLGLCSIRAINTGMIFVWMTILNDTVKNNDIPTKIRFLSLLLDIDLIKIRPESWSLLRIMKRCNISIVSLEKEQLVKTIWPMWRENFQSIWWLIRLLKKHIIQNLQGLRCSSTRAMVLIRKLNVG